MNTFDKTCAQGDVFFRRIDALPSGLTEVKPSEGVHIVTHSETGHNHVIDARPNVKLYESADPLVAYLQVIEATEEAEAVILRHMRSYDTHGSIAFSPGVYEVRRQREAAPSGWARVQD
jgi:hypothetical protein